jgi:hypothetical protein
LNAEEVTIAVGHRTNIEESLWAKQAKENQDAAQERRGGRDEAKSAFQLRQVMMGTEPMKLRLLRSSSSVFLEPRLPDWS